MNKSRRCIALGNKLNQAHATESAIAPLTCFVLLLTLFVLLRLITIFGAITARCIDTDEFWYTATGGNWPLIGSFALLLFLVLVWSVLLAFSNGKRSGGARFVAMANIIGAVAMLAVPVAAHNAATFSFNERAGLYSNIEFRPYVFLPWQVEDECVTMRRFSGRWTVVDRKVGSYGFDVPAQWIELKEWGYAHGQDANWAEVHTGRWRPPFGTSRGHETEWRDGEVFDTPWDFELSGDTLTLTTPDWLEHEWQRSRIVLQRESMPDVPAFPNPHGLFF